MKLAAKTQEDFELLLTKFGMERLLYRLGESEYRDLFVLKGALLFEAWTEQRHRPTRDIDLLGRRVFTEAEMTRIFREICSQPVDDDGLNVPSESVRVERIREQQRYEGSPSSLRGKTRQYPHPASGGHWIR